MKDSSLFEMHSHTMPGGKIVFTVEDGFVSGKQLLDGLGLRSRTLLTKIPPEAETRILRTTSKPASGGYRAYDLVQVLKSLKMGSLKNPEAVKFVIEMLVELVASDGKIVKAADAPKVETRTIIDLDRKPLTPEDFFRKDASLTALQGDDIGALIDMGRATLYDANGFPRVEFLNLSQYDGSFRRVQKELGLLTVREAVERHPDKLVYDTRVVTPTLNWFESQRENRLVYDNKLVFKQPQPWVSNSLLVRAENLRSKNERESYEQRKREMLEAAKLKALGELNHDDIET